MKSRLLLLNSLVAILALPEAATGAMTWRTLSPASQARQEVAVATSGGKVYLIGGIRETSISSAMEEYDPATDQWRFRASLPEPLHHSVAMAHGGLIYVFGGYRSLAFDSTSAAYRYDPSTDRWTAIAPMPASRGAPAGAVIGDRLYVVGGASPQTNSLIAYIPAENRWITLSPMRVARDHLAAAAISGRLYVAGGRNGSSLTLDILEEYDPQLDRWITRASMPTGRSGIAAEVLRGRMFVFGGEGNNRSATGTFAEVESYDPLTDQWVVETPMAVPRHGIGAAAIDGKIYVPAGATRQGFGPSGVCHSDAVFSSLARARETFSMI